MTDTAAPTTVSVTVDGQTIEAAKGELVIDAAGLSFAAACDLRIAADSALENLVRGVQERTVDPLTAVEAIVAAVLRDPIP